MSEQRQIVGMPSLEQQAINRIMYYRLDQMTLHRIAQMRERRAELAEKCGHDYRPLEGRAGEWLMRCVHCACVRMEAK